MRRRPPVPGPGASERGQPPARSEEMLAPGLQQGRARPRPPASAWSRRLVHRIRMGLSRYSRESQPHASGFHLVSIPDSSSRANLGGILPDVRMGAMSLASNLATSNDRWDGCGCTSPTCLPVRGAVRWP
jgi:hypothetical protein